MKPVSLKNVVNDVLEDLDPLITSRKAQLIIEELPFISGNPHQLYQLFQNLLSNALKFIPDGREPHISVRSSRIIQQGKPFFVISVIDNGIGFEEKYNERIFQLFQRLHTNSEYAGTGIGLTVCRKVAELHGGTIKAKGVPSGGATFTVYLPEH